MIPDTYFTLIQFRGPQNRFTHTNFQPNPLIGGKVMCSQTSLQSLK